MPGLVYVSGYTSALKKAGYDPLLFFTPPQQQLTGHQTDLPGRFGLFHAAAQHLYGQPPHTHSIPPDATEPILQVFQFRNAVNANQCQIAPNMQPPFPDGLEKPQRQQVVASEDGLRP